MHAHTHKAKTPNTGAWGVRALGARMEGQGEREEVGLTVCLLPLKPQRPPSLQHLPPGLRQLQGQRATEGKGSGGKENGGGLGDSHKGREDADPQHRCQLTQGIQEAEGCGPVQGSPSAARRAGREERQRKGGVVGVRGHGEVEARRRAVPKRERKDRGQRGEGGTQGIQMSWEEARS